MKLAFALSAALFAFTCACATTEEPGLESKTAQTAGPGDRPVTSEKRRLRAAEIVPVMRGMNPAINACARRFPGLGMVQLHVDVSATGEVANVQPGQLEGTPPGDCVRSALLTAKFPATGAPTPFDYPIMMK